MSSPAALFRRHALIAAGGVAIGGASAARAQPGRITRIVVPVPAGGGMDACARLFAEYAPREVLGQAVVDNRPGGALRLAIEYVQRAEPDGRTLLFAPASVFTIYPHIYRRLTYDVARDFAPISTFCEFDLALGVPGNSPAGTLAEYLAMVRSQGPRAGSFAVPAAGSAAHFAGARLARLTGLPLEHVPYRGSAPAMQDLVAGNVPAAFNVSGEFVAHRAAGRVKVLATTGARRSPFFPDVPTFAELGFSELVIGEWFGLFAPARTPQPMIEALNGAVAAALRQPEVLARLQQLAYQPLHMPAEAFARRILAEQQSWAETVRATGFVVEE
ncbi:MAG: tripartite tricarboxylate transporter substrate-binding protein [Rhodovarius sp.]|nr:tripartite tricarboxylate transporter substrate-binding protein [Rhodovarius sp.]MCX7931503.1 tripartite tricarboxylate transporter substrate-binding protein [Rhodovarius sp.]MDW8314937.1 tripartite tricarboxylate transporter substrate-binding protein [Rhodovarius sp.]